MKLMGFSLNNLTLFGLVLAIGIVVDDAIVVLLFLQDWKVLLLPIIDVAVWATRMTASRSV
jgi:multidrug efflux pump subunit AcrB